MKGIIFWVRVRKNEMSGAFCAELGLVLIFERVGVFGSCYILLVFGKWVFWELFRVGRDFRSGLVEFFCFLYEDFKV